MSSMTNGIEIRPDDIAHARHVRHRLHQMPEVSGAESRTAEVIAREMRAAGADEILTDLGGHGVAAIFGTEGPTLVIRCELDALPIPEESGVAHTSRVPGHGHLCGHDGHMATLIAVARTLGRAPLPGRTVLLFQPAEEDGTGARAVIADGRLAALEPRRIVALHNMPGRPLGHVALADGPAACASGGLRIRLRGREAHASTPEYGLSPRGAVVTLLDGMDRLAPRTPFPDPGFALITVAGVSMGGTAFGIAPGSAEIRVTVRALRDETMADLSDRAEAFAREVAAAEGLTVAMDWHEVFAACANDAAAVADLRAALDDLGLPHGPEGQPFRPSEDFGLYSTIAPSALFLLGAGEDHPPLHDPKYDFPDPLIETGARIFLRLAERGID